MYYSLLIIFWFYSRIGYNVFFKKYYVLYNKSFISKAINRINAFKGNYRFPFRFQNAFRHWSKVFRTWASILQWFAEFNWLWSHNLSSPHACICPWGSVKRDCKSEEHSWCGEWHWLSHTCNGHDVSSRLQSLWHWTCFWAGYAVHRQYQTKPSLVYVQNSDLPRRWAPRVPNWGKIWCYSCRSCCWKNSIKTNLTAEWSWHYDHSCRERWGCSKISENLKNK